jgi:hypothetical protein
VQRELRGERREGGGHLGLQLQVLQQRPPRDEVWQARLVAGRQLRERQAPQPGAAVRGVDIEACETCSAFV